MVRAFSSDKDAAGFASNAGAMSGQGPAHLEFIPELKGFQKFWMYALGMWKSEIL
ncbi:MAG: hypothetical protein PHQ23_11910 [Candidatus Wallbacteria bacterium]|nr:hypothetical protein [Candidatus Wallbacteria bacterium]